MILNKLGKSIKIFGRKCTIGIVDNLTAQKFYELNHIQGRTCPSKHYGLYYNSSLVACMSFTNRTDNVELVRFCNILNHSVIGGFSKLLKFAIEIYNKDIISFSSNNYSNGNIYKDNGFILVSENKADMSYTDNKIRYNRQGFKKSNLKKLFPNNYDDSLTERENARNNKLYQIWGAGIKKWILKKPTH